MNATVSALVGAIRALSDLFQMNPEKRSILPGMAFSGYASRFEKPGLSEGFQDITEVEFLVGLPFCELEHKLIGLL